MTFFDSQWDGTTPDGISYYWNNEELTMATGEFLKDGKIYEITVNYTDTKDIDYDYLTLCHEDDTLNELANQSWYIARYADGEWDWSEPAAQYEELLNWAIEELAKAE